MTTARAVRGLPPTGVIVQGLLEAVITPDRLDQIIGSADTETAFGLRDQKGQVFPFVTDPCGRTHIFNAAETSLIDQIQMLQDAGIRYGVIDARWRGDLYSRDMTHIWYDAIKNSESGERSKKDGEIKDAIRACAYGVLTSATWKRGLCRSE
ncbi:MAG: U32 family peptidase [Methanospirillum sp.]|uniref:U32 family peptidase n=1 Tax=Methanospirillum sp. TaxID=45200 RepID=UPI0023703F8C|nr:U32 family peptidase [Methanospirillum sp.]MDD1729875.1 U32 family peptidase [Methanospirillum sp.]